MTPTNYISAIKGLRVKICEFDEKTNAKSSEDRNEN
jgi:hypothetical protein